MSKSTRKACQGCGEPIDHARQQTAIARLMDAGYTRAEAVEMMPRCRRCIAAMLARTGRPAGSQR